MRLQTLIDGLSECINDYVEGDLDPITSEMFERFLQRERQLGSFVDQSLKGKMALQDAYKVKAADDFEEKLLKKIAAEKSDKSEHI